MNRKMAKGYLVIKLFGYSVQSSQFTFTGKNC